MRFNGGKREPNIVVIGGGTGISVLLRGLKERISAPTAIVTMFDNGGSSGLLRYEFGYPPFGDVRQCLLAMSDGDGSTLALRRLFEFRFSRESSLNGHSLGNLLLAAFTSLSPSTEEAINEAARLLRVRGQVVPVTYHDAELCAELDNGRLIRGESIIDLRQEGYPRIRRIFLDQPVLPNPRALAALLEADAIILGPGDLYTSVLPNLLVPGIPQALAETGAVRIYIVNIMTKLGETDGFRASDFVRQVLNYMAPARLDWVLVNNGQVPGEIQALYQREGAEPVEPDAEIVRRYVPNVLTADLDNDGQLPLRHHSARTAAAVLHILRLSCAARGGAVRLPTLGSKPAVRSGGVTYDG